MPSPAQSLLLLVTFWSHPSSDGISWPDPAAGCYNGAHPRMVTSDLQYGESCAATSVVIASLSHYRNMGPGVRQESCSAAAAPHKRHPGPAAGPGQANPRTL